MDIYVLNDNFETVAIIDDYVSLVWTERYAKPGDFSMELLAKKFGRYAIVPGYFLWRKDTNVVMLIEYIRLVTDTSSGDTVQVKGRSLECYLDRRVIEGKMQFDESNLLYAVQQVLAKGLRRVSVEWIIDIPRDTRETFSGEFRGETVLDALEEICGVVDYGFSLKPEKSFERLTLRVFKGTDRSWGQDERPWVVYSPKLDTLLTSEFVLDDSDRATEFVICGEEASQTINPTTDEVFDWEQIWVRTSDTQNTGWNIREKFIDGSSISRWQGDYILGTFEEKDPKDVTHGWKKLNADFYRRLLLYKTKEVREELRKNTLTFEATGDANTQWHINEDIFLGDLVEVVNEYGVEARCRITEVTLSHDRNGIKFYPIFKSVDDTINTGGIKWPLPSDSITRSTTIGCTTRPNL